MQMTPYLFFDGRCEEAFSFYERVLGGKVARLFRYGGSPNEDKVPADWQDKVMHATLTVGSWSLMASDAPPNCPPSPNGVLNLSVGSADEAERLFGALSDGGRVTMPIEETFWAVRFGMLVDRFGVPWMIGCEKPADQIHSHDAASGGVKA